MISPWVAILAWYESTNNFSFPHAITILAHSHPYYCLYWPHNFMYTSNLHPLLDPRGYAVWTFIYLFLECCNINALWKSGCGLDARWSVSFTRHQGLLMHNQVTTQFFDSLSVEMGACKDSNEHRASDRFKRNNMHTWMNSFSRMLRNCMQAEYDQQLSLALGSSLSRCHSA